ncbi:TetR/AcrR family transcriptional regulator [Hyphococcus sp.]|uniref:TetR/AcrR family transcriptional regulator n=1 Tax=Hyphococcus sp. TaxID=2038636 RepID=UPI0035C777E3
MHDKREEILTVARAAAQAHGYNGLNFRELAKAVGVKSASVHYHFPTKADLGAELARRYREEAEATLESISASSADPARRLRNYVGVFRLALENNNRMCMCGLMAAEVDDLPDAVKAEVKLFGDVNAAWLAKTLGEASEGRSSKANRRRALAVFAAVSGAQLIARGRGDVAVYDDIVNAYRASGLIPA